MVGCIFLGAYHERKKYLVEIKRLTNMQQYGSEQETYNDKIVPGNMVYMMAANFATLCFYYNLVQWTTLFGSRLFACELFTIAAFVAIGNV